MQASYFFRKSSQLATPVWALTPVVNVASMNATLVTIAERRMGNSPYDGVTDNPRTSVARRLMPWARYFALALRVCHTVPNTWHRWLHANCTRSPDRAPSG